MRTVVIGMGNRLLADDAVGCVVSERLGAVLAGRPDVACREAPYGGLRLMELMVGFERAIVVDALQTSARPGTVVTLRETELRESRNTASSHNGTLANALAVGRAAGLELPERIEIWGIEADDTVNLGRPLSAPVARAVEQVVARLSRELAEAGV